MRKKKFIKEKYRDENTPNTDLDYIEFPLLNNGDLLTYQTNEQDPYERQREYIKKQRLIRKTFKAAALVLTDRQFQIFILRYIFGLKEQILAQQIHVNQSYVASVLKASFVKIRKALRLKAGRVLPFP